MDVGLDPELTKWSVRPGPVNILTGKGYKEHHWLVVPSINLLGYLYFHSTKTYSIMPMSARTIPGTQDEFGRGRAAVRVRGQTGNRTNAGRAITPFMFNEEGYRVSPSRTPPNTCTEFNHSTLVMRRVGSILRQTSSTAVPTPMIRIKTDSKISSVPISSTLLVA